MKRNVGGADRIIRIVGGLVILIVGLMTKSWWGLVGLVPLSTGLIGWCGLYPIFRISTCKAKRPAQTQ